MPLNALFLVLLFQTPRSIFIYKCTNLKVIYRITLIVLVIGKAQFRRAMLSCDSSCSVKVFKQGYFSHDFFNILSFGYKIMNVCNKN